MKKNIIFFIAFFSLPMILFGQQYQDYFKSGKQKMENYQFNEAIRDLDMVINLNRESSGMSKQISRSIALILKSYCLFYLGNFDSSLASINEYKICASWDRNQSDVMLIKAQIEYYQKNYRSALLNINSYISKRKKSSLGYYVRAFIFESLSQQENALKDYRKVIELDKSSLVKALSLQKVGLYEKAIIMIHEIIKKEPQKAENKYTEALIEFSEKKSDAGYFMLETAMQGGYKPPILTLCLEVFNVTDSERFKELLAKYDIPNLKGERAKQEKEIKEGVELVAFNQIKAKATVFYANEIKQELVKSPLFSPKDEFESQSAYQDRLKKAEDYKSEVQKKYVALYKEYSERKESERIEKIKNSYTHVDLKITGLGTYNVEKQIFPVTIEGLNIKDRLLFDMELGVPLQDAKSFKENLKDVKVIAERQLKDDALNYHCFNFEVTHPVTGVKYTLASYTPLYLDYVSKDMAESGVPKLDATVKFIEPSGNNLLDGEEKAKFEVTIKNAGTGSAQNIKVNLSTIDNNGFTYEKNKSLTGIAPNQSQTVIFELNADRKINSKEIPFKFDITESRGFNPAGILYSINTQAFKTPNLTVKDIGIKEVTGNNNSIIENGEKIEVSVLVQNTGQGKTENTKAVFDISDKNILSLSPDRMIQNVGALNPGESRLLTFDFTVNNIYAGSDLLPIKVVLSEKYNEYGGTFPLKLEMKKVQLATKNIKVSGLYDQKIEIKDISLTAETDKNIPETATKNPYRFALIIGNEDYKSFQPDLNGEVNVLFAENDAKTLKEYAVKTLGVPEENITLLINATAGRMNQALAKMNLIAKNSNGKAELIFYYAGHGLPDENTKEPYLIPVDVSGANFLEGGIELKNVYAKLTEFTSKKVSVFIDACFSGGARNQGLLSARAVKIKPKETSLAGNIVVFSASSGEQSSLPYQDKQHGMFTYFLLKKIQDTKGDISLKELSDYVSEQVSLQSVNINNKEQTPVVNAGTDSWGNWLLK